ncbi:MAG: hypothetical protein K6U87_06100 [Firmicutes bacterium]|nr:hypothetical protein [Bacillota bacterium]
MGDGWFPLGAARWRASCEAVAEAAAVGVIRSAPVHRGASPRAQHPLERGGPPMQGRGIGATWLETLAKAQGGACFWCGRPLGRRATLEHVLPFSHPDWPALPRVVQLLCLRLAHGECNQAYNTWRQTRPPARVAEVDAMVLRVARQIVRRHPLLALAASRQDRGLGAAG